MSGAGPFPRNVLTTAAPCGITIALAVLMAVVFGQSFQLDQDQVEAMCVLFTGSAILLLLYYICHPWTPVRVVLFGSMTFLFFLGYFGLTTFSPSCALPPPASCCCCSSAWAAGKCSASSGRYSTQRITLVPSPPRTMSARPSARQARAAALIFPDPPPDETRKGATPRYVFRPAAGQRF